MRLKAAAHGRPTITPASTVVENATVEASFGGVELREVKGRARVNSGNSSIRLSGIGGEVYAKTSFNGVSITDAAGPATLENQNGSGTEEGRAGHRYQPISLRTRFVAIRV